MQFNDFDTQIQVEEVYTADERDWYEDAITTPNETPWGVSPSQESWIQLPAGLVMVFESTEQNPSGTTYIRFLDKNGGEVGYWTSDEWRDAPEEVMGAVCGLMTAYKTTDNPLKFYQFGQDSQFPHGVEFVPF